MPLTLDAYEFSVFALPNLIVAAATLLWGLLLRWRMSESSAGVWALVVAVSVVLWQAAYAMGYISRTPEVAQQWIALGQIGIIFIGPGLYELLRRLLGLSDWRDRLSGPIWIAAVGLLYVLLATDDFLGAPYHYAWGYYADYHLGGTLLGASLCATLLFLFVCSFTTWRASPRDSGRRHRARILLYGFSVSFLGVFDFAACWGFALYPFGYVMVAFTVVTIGYAAWRYRVVAVGSHAAAMQVLKTLSDGVLVLDDLGAISVVNEQAALLLGRPHDDLIGRTMKDILPALNFNRELSGNETSGTVDTEVRLTGRDGVKRTLNVKVNVMRDAHGDAPLTVYALQDVTRYREALERIRKLVWFDQATGLPNKRHLDDKLGQALGRATLTQGIAVCALRLEHVRRLADMPGAPANPLQAEISARLKRFVASVAPGTVTAARIQSHEFVLLFERMDSVGKLTTQLNRLNAILREPVDIGGRSIQPVLWLGVSLYPNDGETAAALLERAAAAMDQAAEDRASQVHFFNAAANAAALQSLALDSRLARAIEANELQPWFQPVINTDTGGIEYAEALVRWRDPERGLRLPDEFIPVAEESGLIVTLDRWMLSAACAEAAQWNSQTSAPRVAVNVSGAHLAATRGADLAAAIGAILERDALTPDRLELEITETHVVTADKPMLNNLRRLRDLGVRIAVDDFGTGYASLNYLQQFPLDSLKIDASYTMAIGRDQTRTALLQSILTLASQLELEVVAEGVEAPHQAAFLRRYGCHLMQGYLFCRPLPADEFRHFVETWTGHTDITLRLLSEG
ncbi:MAG TPA: EAL domain-containing protein [Gammaproteobacteria bacterium]|nr:EAL domain-containing protein [Gammaproteobacteria bacterium]